MWRPFLVRSSRAQPCLILSNLWRRPASGSCAAGKGTSRASNGRSLISPRAYSNISDHDPELDTMAGRPPCNGADDDDRYQIRTPAGLSENHHQHDPVGCRRRHLYLILDEMRRGYGIYKLDLANLDGGDESALAGTHDEAWSSWRHWPPRRLPEAALRLSLEAAHFESLGGGSRKIVVTGYGEHRGDGRMTLVYDTETAKLDFAEPPPDGVSMWDYHAAGVPAGDRLYTLGGGSPCFLCQEPAMPERDDDEIDHGRAWAVFRKKGRTERWAWKTGPSPLPRNFKGRHLGSVRSCAVHPDGRTIFASSSNFTFSLDAGTGVSAARGRWCLPFEGRAFYDAGLGAWVGIRTVWHDDFNRRRGRSSSFYLCCCDVPDDDHLYVYDDDGYVAAPPLPEPKWEACEQELTFRGKDDDDDDDDELQPGRSSGDLRGGLRQRALVHTGRGRFCLVETWPTARSKESPCTCSGDGVEHLLLVTMFRAKHGKKKGELVVSPCRPGRSYIVPNYCSDPPVAFWM